MNRIIQMFFLLPLALLFSSCGGLKISPPEQMPTPPTKKANRLLMSGLEAKNNKRYGYAINKFEKALELSPGGISALNGLIDSYWALSDCQNVIKYGTEAIGYKSSFYNKFVVKTANCLAISGDDKKALELYNLAIGLDSADFTLYYNRGLAFAKIEDYVSGKNDIIHTIGMQANYAPAHWGLYKMSMALSDYRGATSSLLFMYLLASNSPTAKENLSKLELLLYPNNMVEAGNGKSMMVPQIFSSMRNKILRGSDGFSHLRQFTLKFISQMATYGKTQNNFIFSFYGSFFQDLIDSEFEEEFCYYIFSDSEKEVVSQWVNENSERILKFERWLKSKNL